VHYSLASRKSTCIQGLLYGWPLAI